MLRKAVICVIVLLWGTVIGTDIPKTINYQGLLTDKDTGEPINGLVNLTVILYRCQDCSEPENILWAEIHSDVQVDDGMFNVVLGSTLPIPDTAFSEPDRWLGITVGSDPEISPRVKLASQPYSYQALTADSAEMAASIPDNSVTSEKIADGEIADWDISPSADIAVEKISGTAVNLTGYQTITGEKTFNNHVNFQDSTMIVRSYGVGIGSSTGPDGYSLLKVQRTWSNDIAQYGQEIDVYNSGSDNLYGLKLSSTNTNPSAGAFSNHIYGINAYATGNTDFRTGVFGLGQTLSEEITTGFTQGVHGEANYGQIAYGIYGAATGALINWSGYFEGDVYIGGTLTGGKGLIRVDHPLDPENMYIDHALIGSNEMKNVYDGTITTDAQGMATVTLPDYVEAYNKDFRYQLTVMGEFAQAIVAEEINSNRFVIKTDKPNVKVSWQVTGIRKDRWAEENQHQAEVKKRDFEQSRYNHPEAFGFDNEKSINYEIKKATLKAPQIND